jgi:dTDP-4-dehydrorhamnose reductase
MKALIVSADARIGAALCERLGAVGTTRRQVGPDRPYFDLRHLAPLPFADLTYFCSGIVGFARCAADPLTAHEINVVGNVRAAQGQVERGGRVVFLSSCAAETHPDTVYGTLKRETERAFLKFGEAASIFRFGAVDSPHKEYPIGLNALIAALTAPFKPGLQRLYVVADLEMAL